MRCDRVIEELSAYLDGELNAAEMAEVRAHLDGCAQCRADLDSLRQAAEGVKALPRATAPADLRDKVMARLEEEPARERSHWRHWRTWWGAAAAVVIGVAIMFLYRPASPFEASSVEHASALTAKKGDGLLVADGTVQQFDGTSTNYALQGGDATQQRMVAKAPVTPPGAELRAYDEVTKAVVPTDAEIRGVTAGKRGPTHMTASAPKVEGVTPLPTKGVPPEQGRTTVVAVAPPTAAKPAEDVRTQYAYGVTQEWKLREKAAVAQAPAAPPVAVAQAAPQPEGSEREKTRNGAVMAKSAPTPAKSDGVVVAKAERRDQYTVDKDAVQTPKLGIAPAKGGPAAGTAASLADVQTTAPVNVAGQNAVVVRVTEIVVSTKDPAAARTQVQGLLARRGVALAPYNVADYNDNRTRREEAVQMERKAKESQAGADGGAISVYMTPAQLGQFQTDLAESGLLKRSSGQVVAAPANTRSLQASNALGENSPPQLANQTAQERGQDLAFFRANETLVRNTPEGRVPVIVIFERAPAAK